MKRLATETLRITEYGTCADGPLTGPVERTTNYFSGDFLGLKQQLGVTEVINDVRLVLIELRSDYDDSLLKAYCDDGEILNYGAYRNDLRVLGILVRVKGRRCARVRAIYGISRAIVRVEKGNIWSSDDGPIRRDWAATVPLTPDGDAGSLFVSQIYIGDLTDTSKELGRLPLGAFSFNKIYFSESSNERHSFTLNLDTMAFEIQVYVINEDGLGYSRNFTHDFDTGGVSRASLSNKTHTFAFSLCLYDSDSYETDCSLRHWDDTEIWEICNTPNFGSVDTTPAPSCVWNSNNDTGTDFSGPVNARFNFFNFGKSYFENNDTYVYYEIHAAGTISAGCNLPNTTVESIIENGQYASNAADIWRVWDWIGTSTSPTEPYVRSDCDSTPFRLFPTYDYAESPNFGYTAQATPDPPIAEEPPEVIKDFPVPDTARTNNIAEISNLICGMQVSISDESAFDACDVTVQSGGTVLITYVTPNVSALTYVQLDTVQSTPEVSMTLKDGEIAVALPASFNVSSNVNYGDHSKIWTLPLYQFSGLSSTLIRENTFVYLVAFQRDDIGAGVITVITSSGERILFTVWRGGFEVSQIDSSNRIFQVTWNPVVGGAASLPSDWMKDEADGDNYYVAQIKTSSTALTAVNLWKGTPYSLGFNELDGSIKSTIPTPGATYTIQPVSLPFNYDGGNLRDLQLNSEFYDRDCRIVDFAYMCTTPTDLTTIPGIVSGDYGSSSSPYEPTALWRWSSGDITVTPSPNDYTPLRFLTNIGIASRNIYSLELDTTSTKAVSFKEYGGAYYGFVIEQENGPPADGVIVNMIAGIFDFAYAVNSYLYVFCYGITDAAISVYGTDSSDNQITQFYNNTRSATLPIQSQTKNNNKLSCSGTNLGDYNTGNPELLATTVWFTIVELERVGDSAIAFVIRDGPDQTIDTGYRVRVSPGASLIFESGTSQTGWSSLGLAFPNETVPDNFMNLGERFVLWMKWKGRDNFSGAKLYNNTSLAKLGLDVNTGLTKSEAVTPTLTYEAGSGFGGNVNFAAIGHIELGGDTNAERSYVHELLIIPKVSNGMTFLEHPSISPNREEDPHSSYAAESAYLWAHGPITVFADGVENAAYKPFRKSDFTWQQNSSSFILEDGLQVSFNK